MIDLPKLTLSMNSFKVWYTHKNGSAQYVDVYDVVRNKNGYPHFLIYVDNQWKYVSAKNCKPLTYS